MRRSVLIVEDDQYKAKDLLTVLSGRFDVSVVGSVRDAVVKVIEQKYDVVILDMALPTFAMGTSSPGGTAQAQGGVEVVRAMKAKGSCASVVIVSQYTDFEMDGNFVGLAQSAETLTLRYGVNVVGAVIYDFEDRAWVKELEEVMSEL